MDANTLKHGYFITFHKNIINEPEVDEFCRLLRRNKIPYKREEVGETIHVDFIATNKQLPFEIGYFIYRHIDNFNGLELTVSDEAVANGYFITFR